MLTARGQQKLKVIGSLTPTRRIIFPEKSGNVRGQNPCGQNKMGGAKYNPVAEAGVDDAVEPGAIAGKQLYKHLTNKAIGKSPVSVKWGPLGLSAGAGLAAESSTRYALDATRDGNRSENPYIDSLERLGSRMVGGATAGTVYGAASGRVDPRLALLGAAGGAAIDATQNISGIISAIPEMIQLKKEADLRLVKDRAATAKTVWENLQKEQKKRDANLAENNK